MRLSLFANEGLTVQLQKFSKNSRNILFYSTQYLSSLVNMLQS